MSVRQVAMMVGLLAACSGGGSNPALGPAKKCLMNSECASPLSCTFGYCHAACREARDCPAPGQICVRGVGGNVCSVPEDSSKCALNSMCEPPLVCGRDLHCRNECETERDCATATQRCVPSGEHKVCAEPFELDGKGLLPPPDGGAPATPDAGADAAADASSDADAAPGADGPPGADAAVDAPPGAETPCGFTAPADSRAQPLPLTPGQDVRGCMANMKDEPHYYALTAPASDPAGGYYRVTVADVGANGVAQLTVYLASDLSIVGGPFNAPNSGASQAAFFSVAPGTQYVLGVIWSGGWYGAFPYTMKVAYTPIADAFEPNDTRPMARAIQVGTPITAYQFAGLTSFGGPVGRIYEPAYQDWYQVTLAAGMVTVVVENAASDRQPQVILQDAVGAELKRASAANAGAGVTLGAPVAAAGTYYILVSLSPGFIDGNAGAGTSPPAGFTMPYRLTVSQ